MSNARGYSASAFYAKITAMDVSLLGNLITLLVVGAALAGFRLSDKRSRNLQAARTYGKQLEERLKDELSSYIDKKKNEITGYGAKLAAEKSSAKAVLTNVSKAVKDCEERKAALDTVNERLRDYDARLVELVTMTERVEDNLQRIAAESEFVENAAQKVHGAQEKFEELLEHITAGHTAIDTNIAESLAAIESSLNQSKARLSETLSAQKQDFETRIKEQRGVMSAVQREIRGAITEEQRALEEQITAQREAARNTAAEMRSALDAEKRAFEAQTQEQREDMENLFTTHREKIEKSFITQQEKIAEAEKIRAAAVERDAQQINTLLKEAVDHAGARAGKLEDEIYRAFRTQTEERAARLKDDIDVELNGIRSSADELRAASTEIAALEDRVQTSLTALEDEIGRLTATAKESALAAAKKHFEEYKRSEDAILTQFKEHSGAARSMDAELRLQLESTNDSIKKQISAYEAEASSLGEKVTAEFHSAVETLRVKVRDIESEIEKIKKDAYERTAENLRVFEDSFAADLARRSENIESRFTEWRDALNNRFTAITENQEAECRRIETSFGEGLRKKTAELDSAFIWELERIKNAAAEIEGDARKQMAHAEETLGMLKEQMKEDFTGLRETSQAALSAEISKNSLESADKLKSFFREIEGEQKRITGEIDAKHSEITEHLTQSRGEIDKALSEFSTNIKEITAGIEDIRKRGREAVSESDDKITTIRAAIDDIHNELINHKEELLSGTDEKSRRLETAIASAEEKVREFIQQSKVIDKTIEMKNDLSRAMDDLNDDFQRLAQQKAEVDILESQFAKIKRMEDEVNAKMTRFITEQRRIDLMEENFHKLLSTSASVDEKLSTLSANNDMLQELQLQFRKLAEAMQETEERYQRVEKKNQILDATTDGIDKNFRALQESEKTAKQFEATITHLSGQLTEIRAAMDNLMSENAKVVETSQQLATLDIKLAEIEKRIEDMQKARQWLADLEGRINSTYESAKAQAHLAGEMLKKEGGKPAGEERSISPTTREEVIRLARMGWKHDEIARNFKIPISAVELILEMAPRDAGAEKRGRGD